MGVVRHIYEIAHIVALILRGFDIFFLLDWRSSASINEDLHWHRYSSNKGYSTYNVVSACTTILKAKTRSIFLVRLGLVPSNGVSPLYVIKTTLSTHFKLAQAARV